MTLDTPESMHSQSILMRLGYANVWRKAIQIETVNNGGSKRGKELTYLN